MQNKENKQHMGARQIAFSKKITYNWFSKIFFRLYLTQISQIFTDFHRFSQIFTD